ncbi:hypothetical protein CANARDRAFT_228984 [[Candida] arabinofermentans NRRL YB-2248]|uniref:Homeobox domain-containing protein n=1 Tax=[Candida] arabinofermentans NRRL YB-2248 TaxID=983967 RepID=A0A1E4T8Z1_9ASCO|nr:hypothetical protein CANARDRAFT_228984 [[Candida] arabinofermentans NRRL YB-2248]
MQMSNIMNSQNQNQNHMAHQQRFNTSGSPYDLLPTPHQHLQQFSNARRVQLPSIKSIFDSSVLDDHQGAIKGNSYPALQIPIPHQYTLSPLQSRSNSLTSLIEYQIPSQSLPNRPNFLHNGSFPGLQSDQPLRTYNQSPNIQPHQQRSSSAPSLPIAKFDATPSSAEQGIKRRSNLPKKTTVILLNWLNDNLEHPYPNSKEKLDLTSRTGLTIQQLSNWFINARRRKIQMLREIKTNSTTV